MGVQRVSVLRSAALSVFLTPLLVHTCQIGVKGEKEAVQHARATGHQNFSEYH